MLFLLGCVLEIAPIEGRLFDTRVLFEEVVVESHVVTVLQIIVSEIVIQYFFARFVDSFVEHLYEVGLN